MNTRCYYCYEKFVGMDDVVGHSIDTHPSKELCILLIRPDNTFSALYNDTEQRANTRANTSICPQYCVLARNTLFLALFRFCDIENDQWARAAFSINVWRVTIELEYKYRLLASSENLLRYKLYI